MSCSEEFQIGQRVEVAQQVCWVASVPQWSPKPGDAGIVKEFLEPKISNWAWRVVFEEDPAAHERVWPFHTCELKPVKPNDWEDDLELL